MLQLHERKSVLHVYTYVYIYIYMYVYIYTYMHMYMYMYMPLMEIWRSNFHRSISVWGLGPQTEKRYLYQSIIICTTL